MTARIIDGKALAERVFTAVTEAVHRLAREHGIEPALAVVLVGNNPASGSTVPTFMPVNVAPTVMSTKNIYTGPSKFWSWFPSLNQSKPQQGLNTSVFPQQKDQPGQSSVAGGQEFQFGIGNRLARH